MSFKGVLVIIGIVALGVVITFGVEEIRFRSMNRALVTEVKTLREKNQGLQAKNDDLTRQINNLRDQLETKSQEYEEKISKLEEERRNLKEKNRQLEEVINKVRIILAPME
jgi:predicted  nucleic acid-binding Zn-ribbon protein